MSSNQQMTVMLSRKRTKRWSHRVKTGCATCRQRKIKCDESRPTCDRCTRSGRLCPGYLNSTWSAFGAATPWRSSLHSPQFDSTEEVRDMILLFPQLKGMQDAFMHDLTDVMRHLLNVFLEHIPSRCGHNAALDAATSCAATGIRSIFKQNVVRKPNGIFLADMTTELSKSYSTALSALRRALDDPAQSSTPEVMLAAMLLCCFEALRENTQENILLHISGLAKITQHRGPPQVDSTIEKAFFNACGPLFTILCYGSNSPCFLAEKSWAAAAERLGSTARKTSMKLFFSAHTKAAQICTLLSVCTKFIKQANQAAVYPAEEHRILLQQLGNFEQHFHKWQRNWIMRLSEDGSNTNVLDLYKNFKIQRDGDTEISAGYMCVLPVGSLIGNMLRVALGGTGAVAAAKEANELVEGLELIRKQRREDAKFLFTLLLGLNMRAMLGMAEEWRDFAYEVESKRNRELCVMDTETFLRWTDLAGINTGNN